MPETAKSWAVVAREIGPRIAESAAERDDKDAFVADNYRLLKEHKFFSALVPAELGGGGASHAEMCETLRELAHHCGSTALALSMHQHLVAAQVWNYRHGNPGRAVLKNVAANELVLISTGARDWLESNGSVEKVDGGYRVSASKVFASGSPMGDILVTSAPYDDLDEGPRVLHFPVPFSSDGVRIEENWKVMGMRATGSHTVVLESVFVPEQAIALSRPRGEFHPVWSVVLTVAMPLVMSAYVGVAEAAEEIARTSAMRRRDDPVTQILVGEMENALTTAQVAWRDMVAIANNYDFAPEVEIANAIAIRKTIVSRAVLETAEKAMEVAGGLGFFRDLGLERRVRDAHAAQFHPLQAKRQLLFTGCISLGLDPISD